MQSRIVRVLVDFSIVLVLILLTTQVLTSAQGNHIWEDASAPRSRGSEVRLIIPDRYRTLAADTTLLQDRLSRAPLETADGDAEHGTLIELPLPDGRIEQYRVVESPIMSPVLAEKFPNIRTYAGIGVDDPAATARLGWTDHGFHAILFTSEGTVYIDPYAQNNRTHYISYYKRDFTPSQPGGELPPIDPFEGSATAETVNQIVQDRATAGNGLRTYRLAVATTGEYTAFHGGTVNDGLSAVVTAMNRVTGVYELEVGVRFQLIDNNDQIIYTNPIGDPYNNLSGGIMLNQNQSNIDNVIGSANYDVGHVFSTGGGGIAYLGVICNNSLKAGGVTGLSSPTGDPFYIDFVSHELGHQFGATHTFNSVTGACGGGNRTESTAYEPGSGTSIMAYAGICGADNIQSNSDPFFHSASLDQITAHITAGSGSTCGTFSGSSNTSPTADAGSDYTIPINTPFTLNGVGADADGDTLTYSWEQFDLGDGGSPGNPSGNAPIFRSFTPDGEASRTFPQISDIINNTTTIGELLPSYARSLTFRFIVRDNQAGGGSFTYDTVTLTVVDPGGGTFAVTDPNTGAETWTAETSETVTWNAAGTTSPPINCASVDILLSIDGGNTYPLTLASATANDGSESVTLPNVDDSDARVRVECSDNVFFDISNADFDISSGNLQPPTSVVITGTTNGFAGFPYTFEATTVPTNTLLTVDYAWTATNLPQVDQTSLLTDTVTLTWITPGEKIVNVTASNAGGSISATTPLTVTIDGVAVFLPIIER